MAINPDDLASPQAAIGRYVGQGLFRVVMNLTHDRVRRMGSADEDAITGIRTESLVPPAEFPAEFEDFPELDGEGKVKVGDSIGRDVPPLALPADLFDGVVGLDEEKKFLRQVVQSRNPLHALLIGPPGSGKSLLLEEMRRLEGARYMVPRQLTVKGLRDVLLERPSLVLIEEVGTGDGAFQGMLLTAMDGIVTKDLVGQHEEITDLDTRFVGTCNSTANIIEPLLERFWELPVPDYTPEQKREAIIMFLTRKKGLDAAAAGEVAGLIPPWGGIRDAGQIGEVWRTDPEQAKAMAAALRSRGGPSKSRSVSHKIINRPDQPAPARPKPPAAPAAKAH